MCSPVTTELGIFFLWSVCSSPCLCFMHAVILSQPRLRFIFIALMSILSGVFCKYCLILWSVFSNGRRNPWFMMHFPTFADVCLFYETSVLFSSSFFMNFSISALNIWRCDLTVIPTDRVPLSHVFYTSSCHWSLAPCLHGQCKNSVWPDSKTSVL